ncbi:hypothetical protein PIROE2DRAFT_16644 [Piromyces sp. E2]|nr:hypothetical protein PIROE2DRAFT_16644 [Piromyces sp. E2]|eukprot:OUM58165.1 hypothetical protein PIROE2DRAFT_16644 [Piromyces sp. E2]
MNSKLLLNPKRINWVWFTAVCAIYIIFMNFQTIFCLGTCENEYLRIFANGNSFGN